MAATLLLVAELWAWAGLAVAAVFLLGGVDRVEPNIRGAWTVRPLLVPGIVLLWPLVLLRWARLARGGWDPRRRHLPPRRAQGALALLLALAVPALIAAALAVRPDAVREDAPVLLEAPA